MNIKLDNLMNIKLDDILEFFIVLILALLGFFIAISCAYLLTVCFFDFAGWLR